MVRISYIALLVDALGRVEQPERDAKTLLSSLVEQRPELAAMEPFVLRHTIEEPFKLRLVGGEVADA